MQPQPSQLIASSSQPPSSQMQNIANPPPGSQFHAQLAKKASIDERIKNLQPPSPFPPDFLVNLQSQSVGSLCNIGKELAQEILLRTVHLIQWMQVTAEKRAQKNMDVEAALVYCRRLLAKLVEIRLRVDLATVELEPLDADSFVALMAAPTAPDEDPAKKQVVEKFEKNRKQLIALSNTLKKLEWHALVSDPRQLK